jgi:aspartokinase
MQTCQPCSVSLSGCIHSSWQYNASLQVNIVYKFGGSSVRDAERMREVADIICSFQENLPCVVLSAMGKVRHTTTQLSSSKSNSSSSNSMCNKQGTAQSELSSTGKAAVAAAGAALTAPAAASALCAG